MKTKAKTKAKPVTKLAPPPFIAPVLHVEKKLLKLDLGAGQNPKEGFEGVDLNAPNTQHRVDLFKFPYPWADNSVEEIHTSHFVEHIPNREVEERDVVVVRGGQAEAWERFVGQNLFFAFFDECYRILKPDGVMTVIVPSGRSTRGFQDPTHCRFIMAETFLYLAAEWRKMNAPDHYRVKSNFACHAGHTMPLEIASLCPEAQARRFNESWNVVYDWVATLKSLKT